MKFEQLQELAKILAQNEATNITVGMPEYNIKLLKASIDENTSPGGKVYVDTDLSESFSIQMYGVNINIYATTRAKLHITLNTGVHRVSRRERVYSPIGQGDRISIYRDMKNTEVKIRVELIYDGESYTAGADASFPEDNVEIPWMLDCAQKQILATLKLEGKTFTEI